MTTPIDSTRGREFGRFVKAIAQTRGDMLGAERFAEHRGWSTTAAVCKALVDPMGQSLLDNGLAPVTNDLAALLRPRTIAGRLEGLRRVPFRTRILRQDTGGAGAWVAAGAPIPITEAEFSNVATLEAKKVGAIRILTEELVRSSATGSDIMVARDAASSLVEAMDVAFVDPANGGDDETPPSITSGAQEYSASGSDVASIDADLKLLLGVLIAAECSLSTAAWLMSPKTSAHLSLLRGSSGAPAFPGVTARGGQLLGLPVLTSTHVAATGSPGERFVALVEASEILIADDGQGDIELTSQAAVQMNDAPSSGAQQLVSLWQLNLVGIKAVRFLNWQRRRTGAVATLRNVTY